jgi:hypothetical protein
VLGETTTEEEISEGAWPPALLGWS